MWNVSLTTASARANARSASPIECVKPTPTLVPHSGWTSGLPASAAWSISTTGGSGSQSTSISSTASSARSGLSATTIATISPTWRARSRQRAHWGAWRTSNLTTAASPGGTAPKSGKGFIQRSTAANVRTRTTPGAAAAAAVRMLLMTAWACGERRKAAWSMPGIARSSTKRPSPRRNRGSSRRFTDAPKYFAPMARPARDYTPAFRAWNRALSSLAHSRSRRRLPMVRRSIVLVALVLAALVAVTLPAQSQAPIKIGVIEPLSGPVAASGNYIRMGAEIARDWINAKGGVNGRKVDLLIEDNKSDPKEAASAAEKLIVRDKVPAIMGAWGSSMTLAAMPKLEEYGVPMVVETSSAASITKRGNPWIFRISPPSEMEALGLEQYVDKLGVKQADFLAVNTDWGRGSVTAFGDMLKKKGAAVGAAEFMEQAATDMNAQITKIKSTNGYTLFLTTAVEQITLVLKQGREHRLTRKVITTGGSSSPSQLIKQSGAAAEGSYHIVFFMPWFPEAMPDGRLAKAFVDEWAKRGHPFEGLTEGFRGHDGIATIAEAIRLAGKDEAAAVRDALWKVSLMGVNGPIKFEKDGPAGKESGQSRPSIFVVQIRDGKVALPDFLAKK